MFNHLTLLQESFKKYGLKFHVQVHENVIVQTGLQLSEENTIRCKEFWG